MHFDHISDYEKLLLHDLTLTELQTHFEAPYFFHLQDTGSHHQHSQIIDQLIGVYPRDIEHDLLMLGKDLIPDGNVETWGRRMHEGHQTWVGLDPDILQTPYAEIYEMLKKLDPQGNTHIVDLGAAYGRMGFVLHYLYPEAFFTGYEYVTERVEEGNRMLNKYGCDRALIVEQDLSSEDFKLPEADIYFLYDYGRPDQIRYTLKELERMGEKKNLFVVARGTACRHYIHKSHPWLSQIFDIYHSNEFSIYSNFRDL